MPAPVAPLSALYAKKRVKAARIRQRRTNVVRRYRVLVLERAEKKAGGRAWAMPHHSKSGKGICGQCPFFKHRARALAGGHRAFMGNLL